jgi:hypothetical protein
MKKIFLHRHRPDKIRDKSKTAAYRKQHTHRPKTQADIPEQRSGLTPSCDLKSSSDSNASSDPNSSSGRCLPQEDWPHLDSEDLAIPEIHIRRPSDQPADGSAGQTDRRPEGISVAESRLHRQQEDEPVSDDNLAIPEYHPHPKKQNKE